MERGSKGSVLFSCFSQHPSGNFSVTLIGDALFGEIGLDGIE
jgi:hypothetical protein